MKLLHSKKILALITLTYFILPFLHIGLALAGLICMALPFILLFRDNRLSWCSSYCPRAQLLSSVRFRKTMPPVPEIMKKEKGEKIRGLVLNYFCLNLMLILVSSVMVASGSMAPIERIRLFIVFELPFQMPQLLSNPILPPALLHLSYRIYSIMTSSLIAGLLLAVFYRPRTWCAVCPVNTLSKRILHARLLHGSTHIEQ